MHNPDGDEPLNPEGYELLASAIAGRRVSVHRAAAGANHAHSDGRVIYLPADADEPRLALIAQALLLAAGALDAAPLRRLLGRPQAARRYAFLEVLRALALFEARTPPRFCQHPALRGRTPLSDSSLASVAVAQSSRSLGEIPAFIGSVQPLAALSAAAAQGGLAALLQPQPAPHRQAAANGEEQAADESPFLRLLANPMLAGSSLAEALGRLLGTGAGRGRRQRDSAGQGGGDMAVGRIEQHWRRGLNALQMALPSLSAAAEENHGLRYPEWDAALGGYRRDWVSVDVVDPWRADGATDAGACLRPPSKALQRQLSRLGLDYEMHRRQPDGTEFDVGALIDCAIDIAAGQPPERLNVYRASQRSRRDLGAMVIVDVSGSTEACDEQGVPVFEQHLDAACQLTRALDQLGDRVALYGFQSWGRGLVRLLRLKGHEERWSGRVAGRLAQLEPQGFTRIGAAIRHADRVLRTEIRLPNRLLILITDGFSYDHDYDEHYAEADTRKALAEATAVGTACLCLCIGGAVGTEKLQAVFGEVNLLMVDDVEQLPRHIRRACGSALASVAGRRRATPR